MAGGSHFFEFDGASLKLAFEYLLPRIEEMELTGPVSRLHSNLVGGIKHLPIKFKARAA